MILRCSAKEATVRLDVVSLNLGCVSCDLCKRVGSWWPYIVIFGSFLKLFN
jgi:hypothetical protein